MNKYDDLLKELEKLYGAYVVTGNDNSNTAKLLWACHEAIEDLQADKWTRVKDGKPLNGQDVIGYVQTVEESRITACNYDKGTWYDCILNDEVSKNVTHWMPAPLPPTDPEIYR